MPSTVANSGSAMNDGILAIDVGQARRAAFAARFRHIENAGKPRRSAAQHKSGDAVIENARVAQVFAQQFEKLAGAPAQEFAHHALRHHARGRSPTEGTSTSLPAGMSVGTALPKFFLSVSASARPVHMPTERSLVKWSPPME